jgi:hypothetical protein
MIPLPVPAGKEVIAAVDKDWVGKGIPVEATEGLVATAVRFGKKGEKLGKPVGVTTGPDRARQVTEANASAKRSC